MKKLFTLSLSILLVGFVANAQSNTFVLVEESTNASCAPCASQNPAFDALLAANEDKAITLKYQWYFPGYDPMHNDNPTMANTRTSYYGINGVPTGVVNGSLITNDCAYYEGAPACLSQADIDAAHEVISPLTMSVSAQMVNGSMQVTGTITADQALSGNLKLRIAVAEQVIDFGSAPGTNGESEFFHVMKTFIGGTAGISLDDFMMGDVYTIDESMSMAGINVYDYGQLEVIAFVQNDAGKAVYQAAKDDSIEIIIDAANNATAGSISGTPSVLCAGEQTISPVFRLGNGGSEDLTSCDIIYSVNGGPEQTYAWTGSLVSLAEEEVTLDPISFEVTGDMTTIDVMVANPNGMTDEVVTDDNSALDIETAPSTEFTAELVLTTDGYGDEVYWEVRNSSGDIVASGGNPNVGLDNVATGTFPPPFSSESYGNNQTYNEEITLSSDDCYTFHITDYYGDGLLGTAGYSLRDNTGAVMHSDVEDYQGEAIKDFSGTGAVGIEENMLSQGMVMSPNPVVDILNVKYTLVSPQEVVIRVMNSLGQEVATEFVGTRSAGQSNTQIDMSLLDAGVYYVNIIAGTESAVRKISVIH